MKWFALGFVLVLAAAILYGKATECPGVSIYLYCGW